TNVDLGAGNSDSASLCVPPVYCTAPDQCTNPETCWVRRDQNDATLLCRDSNPSGGTLGQVCVQDSDCAENLCVDGRFGKYCATPCDDASDCGLASYTCTANTIDTLGGGTTSVDLCTPPAPIPCVNTSDCSVGSVCGVIPNLAGNGLEAVCIPTSGGSQTGIPCTLNSNCRSNVCADGFCAALCDGAGNGAECIQDQICVEKTVMQSGLSGDFDVCLTLPDVPCDASADCQAAVPEDTVRVCGDIRTAGAFCEFPNPPPAGPMGSMCNTNVDCRDN